MPVLALPLMDMALVFALGWKNQDAWYVPVVGAERLKVRCRSG